MTKHIIVGYDGSPSANAAVRWAADEATTCAAPLRIVSCYDIPLTGMTSMGMGYPEAFAVIEGDTRRRAADLVASLRETHPSLEVSTVVTSGPASSTLLDDTDPEDLVVVGSSGRDHAAAFWLGSTPRRVIHHSHCPVAIIRGAATGATPARVVVGVDGSPTSDDALAWAGDEADRHQAELVVVHGWAYPYLAVDSSSLQARDLTQVDAACTLDAAVEQATARFASPVTGCLIEATPATALLQTVRDGDLLVVGSRGRGAVVSAVFGSTVNIVAEQCAVPMIVVR